MSMNDEPHQNSPHGIDAELHTAVQYLLSKKW